MTDSAALPPETPDPLHGHVPIPPGAADSPPEESSVPSSSSDATPLGSANQYHHAPNLPSFNHQVSVTGATKDDPAGKLSREAVLYDPEWASPTAGFWTVLGRGYGFSFLAYWLGYGFSLVVGLGVAQVFLGRVDYLTASMLGAMLLVGPPFGFILDFSILNSHSAVSLTGGLFLLLEPLLGFLILVTHERRARLRYCGLMFGLVLLKAVVYVLVNSAA